jgi:hypothetical protein
MQVNFGILNTIIWNSICMVKWFGGSYPKHFEVFDILKFFLGAIDFEITEMDCIGELNLVMRTESESATDVFLHYNTEAIFSRHYC